MTAIIIEDDQKATHHLVLALQRTCLDVKITGICTKIDDAIFAIRIMEPDLIFLNVCLNGQPSAFEILDLFVDHHFKVIFTTADGKYALAAFEYNAVQFLLIPYTDERLANAVNRAKLISLGEQKENISDYKRTDDLLMKRSDIFPFRNNKGIYSVRNFNDIMYLETEGSSVSVFINDESIEITTNTPLTEYANILVCRGFILISQNNLVNLTYILNYIPPGKATKHDKSVVSEKTEGGGGSVTLKNKKQLPVSRLRGPEVRKALGIP